MKLLKLDELLGTYLSEENQLDFVKRVFAYRSIKELDVIHMEEVLGYYVGSNLNDPKLRVIEKVLRPQDFFVSMDSFDLAYKNNSIVNETYEHIFNEATYEGLCQVLKVRPWDLDKAYSEKVRWPGKKNKIVDMKVRIIGKLVDGRVSWK